MGSEMCIRDRYSPAPIRLFLQQLLRETQRVIRRVAHPKHPLISSDRPDRITHLGTESLEGQLTIPLSESRAQGPTGTLLSHRKVKRVDSFRKPPPMEVIDPLRRNTPRLHGGQQSWQMEAVNCGKKGESSYPGVEIPIISPELVERDALLHELVHRKPSTNLCQGGVTNLGLPARDYCQESGHAGREWAVISMRSVST